MQRIFVPCSSQISHTQKHMQMLLIPMLRSTLSVASKHSFFAIACNLHTLPNKSQQRGEVHFGDIKMAPPGELRILDYQIDVNGLVWHPSFLVMYLIFLRPLYILHSSSFHIRRIPGRQILSGRIKKFTWVDKIYYVGR